VAAGSAPSRSPRGGPAWGHRSTAAPGSASLHTSAAALKRRSPGPPGTAALPRSAVPPPRTPLSPGSGDHSSRVGASSPPPPPQKHPKQPVARCRTRSCVGDASSSGGAVLH
jgi:amphiphysin